MREALYLLEEGALPKDVDAPLRDLGLAMGPFQMSDLAGNDIGYNVRKDNGWTAENVSGRFWAGLADQLVEAGRLGQKTKRGWYDYAAGRAPVDDPEVEAMILEHSRSLGITRREISADEIVDRCLLSMVNEGFKIVEEGIAQRESDCDVVYLCALAWPLSAHFFSADVGCPSLVLPPATTLPPLSPFRSQVRLRLPAPTGRSAVLGAAHPGRWPRGSCRRPEEVWRRAPGRGALGGVEAAPQGSWRARRQVVTVKLETGLERGEYLVRALRRRRGVWCESST